MQFSSGSMSPLDLMIAIVKGKMGPSNISAEAGAAMVIENREIVMLLTTSIAVLIGCVVAFIWRRSSSQKPSAVQPLIVKPEPEIDDGRQKVTIFFGTQTGTAEGFAKALAEEAKARYDKVTFKIVDMDDYAADDEEYEEKLKKETWFSSFLLHMEMASQLIMQQDSTNGFWRGKREENGFRILNLGFLAWATDSMSISTRLRRW